MAKITWLPTDKWHENNLPRIPAGGLRVRSTTGVTSGNEYKVFEREYPIRSFVIVNATTGNLTHRNMDETKLAMFLNSREVEIL